MLLFFTAFLADLREQQDQMLKQGLVATFFAGRIDKLLERDPSAHLFNEVLDTLLKLAHGDVAILPESRAWTPTVQNRAVTLSAQLLERFQDDYSL